MMMMMVMAIDGDDLIMVMMMKCELNGRGMLNGCLPSSFYEQYQPVPRSTKTKGEYCQLYDTFYLSSSPHHDTLVLPLL